MISIIALTLAVCAPAPDLTGVSVSPVADRTEVVIQVVGAVTASDFALDNPARLVLDLSGMDNVRHVVHNVGRGGVRSVRIAPFQPGVARVVIDLEQAVEYQVERVGDAVRITFPNSWGTFVAWTDGAPAPAQRAQNTAPAPEPQAAPPARTAQEQTVHVTFTEEPLANVLAAFADFANRSIIAEADVKGKLITAEVRNQPWDLALDAILSANGLVATENEAGVIIVKDASRIVARQAEEPLISRQFPIRYVAADTLVRAVLGMVSTRGKVVANTTTNALVVTDAASVLEQLAPLIEQLDQRAPQVNISATIAFVDRTALEQLGVTYDVKDSRGNQLNQITPGFIDQNGDGIFQPEEATEENVVLLGGNSIAALANANYPVPNPAIQLVTSLVLGRHTLISFLEALQSVTLSDIQAKPTVTVLNHRQAEIQVGQRTPIRVIEAGAGGTGGGAFPVATVDYQDTGVILNVTPHITGDQIMLDLTAERSDAIPAASDIGFVFSRQNARTQVLVQDGETTVIGGLTIVEKSRVRTGIPLLMDLPILGALFRNTREQEQKRDLLIMVTPHIIRN
jgi:type IV pilus assembly protein PilQ